MARKKAVVFTFFCFACSLVSAPLFGQATGSLLGTVTDSTGAVVPGATVTVTSQGTAASRETKTDDTGHFRLPLLPIGTYSISVSAQGLKTVEQKDIVLQVDENRELDFTLPPASVQQTVEVSATAVRVETANPTLGQVIGSQQVAQLPLNGRDFVQLATLAPGTTKETNPNSFFNGGASSEVSIRGSFSLSVGGSRANSTDWLYDGVDNNELTAGGIAILPNIDVLQEFKVLTYNYSAEYGTRGGPTVLITTKAGTNDIHGSVFEFLRNTSLDARSFFAHDREQFNENEFGGSLGAPIKKDKTFIFADYQGRYLREGITQVATIPTALMKTGDFSEPISGTPIGQLFNPYNTRVVNGQIVRLPFLCQGGAPSPASANGVQTAGTPCNIIPPSLINPIAQQMINFYPNPNVAGTLVGDYVAAPAKKLDEGQFDIRLDHNFSSKDSLFARFSYDQATVFQPSGLPGFVAQPGGFASTQHLDDHGRNAALSETHIFSPTSINQINLGYNRIFNHILSYGSGSCVSQTLGIPGANLGDISCGLVDTEFGSTPGAFWALGDRGFAPFTGGTNVFFIKDSFDAIRGNHDIKVGGEVRFNQLNVKTSAFQDGFWILTNAWTASMANIGTAKSPFYATTFSGGNIMADLLLGLSDLALHDTTFQGPTTGRRWKLLRPYVEDNWRVRPNLTLNLGLAWGFVTPITEVHNRQTNFDFQTGQFLIAGHGGGTTVGLSTYARGLEPRIGLAWSPRGDRKTSIRAAYGIFHDSSWNQGAQGLWENPPYFQESNYTGFFPDACPFATSICASQGIPPTGYSISSGFPILTEPSPSQIVPSTTTNLNATNLNFHPGVIQQFNFNVQRQLPADFVLTAGYAGSRSTNLLQGDYNVNLGSPTACGKVSGYTFGCGLSTPWPQWGWVYGIFDNGFSRYDSLQVKAETTGRHGLYALIAYTYSKNFDNGLADGLGSTIGALYYPLPDSRQADKGLSQIALTHNFTGSVVYDLPFGRGKRYGNDWNGAENAVFGNWQVNVIEHITSGFPLFIVNSGNGSGVNFQWNGEALNRPNRICNGRLSNWTVQEFFNPACFPAAPSGELGNSDRTPLSGPGFVNTDLSAVKNFPLPFREGALLQFRAEFFNLFNTPQFAQPGTDLNTPGLGQITGTVNNPRLIQFALKLTF
jgi:hypothetical protein